MTSLFELIFIRFRDHAKSTQLKKYVDFDDNKELLFTANLAVNSITLLITFIIALSIIKLIVFMFVSLYLVIDSYYKYIEYKSYKNNLKGVLPQRLSFIEIKNKVKKDFLYLGEGFLWGKAQAQKLYNLMEGYELEPVVKNDSSIRGTQYIQSLCENNEIHVPLHFLDGHTIIVGTTGAGKTRLFDLLITQALLRNECVIIIDPKGDKDLFKHTQIACQNVSKEEVLYFHPGFPEKSITINPLYNFNRETELASRIASLLPEGNGSSASFKAYAQMALNVIIGGLILIERRPNLKDIRYYIDSRIMELAFLAFKFYFDKNIPKKYKGTWDKLAKSTSKVPGNLLKQYNDLYLKALKKDIPSSKLEALFILARHDATHYGKMIASLIPILDMLCSGELGDLLSPNSRVTSKEKLWDMERIINKSRVVYIGLDSLTDSIVGSSLGSLLLADLACVAGARYNYGDQINKVNIFVDESSEVINEQLIQILNKGRGAGFRVVAAAQTVADFETRLGSKAKAMQALGNFNNLISLRIIDKETREYVANSFPKIRVKFRNQNVTYSSSSSNITLLNQSITDSEQEVEVSTFPVEMFAEIPDLEFIARVGGATIYKGKIPFIVE